MRFAIKTRPEHQTWAQLRDVWVAADEVYGQDPQLRAELARRGLGYVLAIRKSDPVLTPAGPLPACKLARRLP